MGKASRILKRKVKLQKQTTNIRFSYGEVQAAINHEKAQLLEDVFYRIVAMSALVLAEDFGKLQKKDSRIENYATLLSEKLENFSLDCTDKEKELIAIIQRTGLKVIKDV